ISKATSLSQLAASAYILGSSFCLKLSQYKKKWHLKFHYIFSKNLETVTIFFVFFLSIIYVIYVITTVIYYPNQEVLNTQVVNIVIVFFVIALLISAMNNGAIIKKDIKKFILNNKLLLVSCGLIFFSSMWFGDRGPAIQVFFILMFFYIS